MNVLYYNLSMSLNPNIKPALRTLNLEPNIKPGGFIFGRGF